MKTNSKTWNKGEKFKTTQNGYHTNYVTTPHSEENVEEINVTLPGRASRTTSAHVICLRITLTFCITGATVGFCLLLAGGIWRYIDDMKMLMYVGIMVFLVSVTLMVILCSTWGTGGVYQMVQRPAEQFFVPLPPPRDHIIYPLPSKYISRAYRTPSTRPDLQYPITEAYPADFRPDIESYELEALGSKASGKICKVKNCACQVTREQKAWGDVGGLYSYAEGSSSPFFNISELNFYNPPEPAGGIYYNRDSGRLFRNPYDQGSIDNRAYPEEQSSSGIFKVTCPPPPRVTPQHFPRSHNRLASFNVVPTLQQENLQTPPILKDESSML